MKKYNLPKIMSLIVFGLGIFLLSKNIFLQITGIKTEGVVIEINKKKKENQYYPTVKFVLENGEVYVTDIYPSSNRLFIEKGDTISLIYPKHNHKEAQYNSAWWVYGFPFIFIGIGIIVYALSKHDVWYVS